MKRPTDKAAAACVCAVVAIAVVAVVHSSCSTTNNSAAVAKDSGTADESVQEDVSWPDRRPDSRSDAQFESVDPIAASCDHEESIGLSGCTLNRDWSCAC